MCIYAQFSRQGSAREWEKEARKCRERNRKDCSGDRGADGEIETDRGADKESSRRSDKFLNARTRAANSHFLFYFSALEHSNKGLLCSRICDIGASTKLIQRECWRLPFRAAGADTQGPGTWKGEENCPGGGWASGPGAPSRCGGEGRPAAALWDPDQEPGKSGTADTQQTVLCFGNRLSNSVSQKTAGMVDMILSYHVRGFSSFTYPQFCAAANKDSVVLAYAPALG